MKKVTYISILIILIIYSNPVFTQQFIVGDTVSPFITYSDIPDTSLPIYLQSTSEFKIDIDQDQVSDIRFVRTFVAGQINTHQWQMVFALDSIEFACDTSDFNADTLSPGSIINKDLNWKFNTKSARLFERFYSKAPPPWGPPSYTKGLFRKDSLFLGFRKIYGTDTIYGWFCVKCTASAYIIKSYSVNRNYSSIPDYQSELDLIIYPNPVKQTVTIESPLKEGVMIIYGPGGNIQLSKQINHRSTQIDISYLPGGIYFLKFESDEHVIVRKLIKE